LPIIIQSLLYGERWADNKAGRASSPVVGSFLLSSFFVSFSAMEKETIKNSASFLTLRNKNLFNLTEL
jgi:hypothetical protein